MKNLFTTILFFGTLTAGFSQIVGNSAFAKTNYIQLGYNECGVLGADSIPADFVNPGDPYRSVIWDVNGDGWETGFPNFSGDLINGSYYESFRFDRSNSGHTVDYINSYTSCWLNDVKGGFTNYSANEDSVVIEWTSDMPYFTLLHQSIIYTNKKYIINHVSITNNSFDGHNYYYIREVEPYVEGYWVDSYTNENTIEAKYDNDGYSLVSAVGSAFNTYFAAGSKNERAYTALSNTHYYDYIYEGSASGHYNLNVIFYQPVLLSGETVKFSYAYIFDEDEVEEAINKTYDPKVTFPCVAGNIETGAIYEGAIEITADYQAGSSYELQYAISGTDDFVTTELTSDRYWLVGYLHPCSSYDFRLISMCENDTLYTYLYNINTLCFDDVQSLENQSLNIYPNPATNAFIIEAENMSHDIELIIVTTVNGNIVETIYNKPGNKTININTSNYASGLYAVTIVSGNNSITKSLVITAD